MKQWSTNTDGTYSLNLSNEHGTCSITCHNDHVNLNYAVNGQKFGEAWLTKNTKQPIISQRLALIPILGYISNEIAQAKMKLSTIMTVQLNFDKNKTLDNSMIETLTETLKPNRQLYPELKDKLEELKNSIIVTEDKLKQVIQTSAEFFKTEIKFFEIIKQDIETMLEIPNN